jgi:hypothetical protein
MGCRHGRPDLEKEIQGVVERARAQRENTIDLGGEYTELENGMEQGAGRGVGGTVGESKESSAGRMLVWACGPMPIVEAAGRVACEVGSHFVAESFEL